MISLRDRGLRIEDFGLRIPDGGRVSRLSLATATVFLCVVAVGSGQTPPGKKYQGDCSSSGCHDGYAKKSVVHSPVASKSCDDCHEAVKQEDHRFKLVAEGQALCNECHEEVTEDLKFVHGPAAAGACTVCHDPHASDHPALLPAPNKDVCLSCHTAMKRRLAEKSYKHVPVNQGCGGCHNPHGADNRMNLRMRVPDLCLDCHDNLSDTIDEATVKHDALTQDKSCANCHEPHASDTEKILLLEPMNLCLHCHDKKLKSNQGSISDIAGLLKENPNHHGPIRDKDCSSCHVDVHGGAKYRLLSEKYPAEFYAPFEEARYALCFDCHEADVVLDQQTDELTNFRNGDLNLHYMHVNRKVKGRTCRACHNTHASTNPRHITKSVPFGDSGWEIPLNYKQSPSGGSCLPGCHKKYAYDRKLPVVNIQP